MGNADTTRHAGGLAQERFAARFRTESQPWDDPERFYRERVGRWPVPEPPAAADLEDVPQCADGGDCGCPPEAVRLCPGRDFSILSRVEPEPMPADEAAARHAGFVAAAADTANRIPPYDPTHPITPLAADPEDGRCLVGCGHSDDDPRCTGVWRMSDFGEVPF
jgi:hypothetical protein